MQTDVKERPAKQAGEPAHSTDNLALLYQGLLTGIVRIQARRQHVSDAESFRRRTKAALQEVERDAITAGYDGNDIKDTHFAVVAFLDSVVLNSNDPVRAEWERKTLQEELFGQTDAGVVFFEKLEHFRSRRDLDQLADILEIYLLCLLLGFEGRYSGRLRGELEVITEKVRRRIEDIRGRSGQISPSAGLPSETAPAPVMEHRIHNRDLLVALTFVLFTIVCFIALKMHLYWMAEQLRGRLF
jgi:type VI secretion system protein ImpK